MGSPLNEFQMKQLIGLQMADIERLEEEVRANRRQIAAIGAKLQAQDELFASSVVVPSDEYALLWDLLRERGLADIAQTKLEQHREKANGAG